MRSTIVGVIVGAAAMYAIAFALYVHAQHVPAGGCIPQTPVPSVTPPLPKYGDVNNNGAVNAQDLLCVSVAFDILNPTVEATWSSTPSPTSIALTETPTPEPSPSSTATLSPPSSPTATSSFTATSTTAPTNTPIPTATNTPTASTSTPLPSASSTPTPTISGNSVAAILKDSTGNHDGTICGVGGYSWEFHGDIHAVGNGGYPTGTGWWVFQWDCGFHRSGVRVEIDTFNAYVLNGSTWRQVTNWTTWCNINNTQTNSNLGSCPLGGNTGPVWDMPNAVQSLHGASDHNAVGTATCALTIIRARLNTSARVMLSAGFDYWSGSSIRGAGVGRYVMLSTAYRYVNFSSCSAATLGANPPPLS